MSDEWVARAACRSPDLDPEYWFDADLTIRHHALHICRTHCPVRAECANHAHACRDGPHRYRGAVVGGIFWNENGVATHMKPHRIRCPLCEVPDGRLPH